MKKIRSFEVVALLVTMSLAIVGLLNNSYFTIHDSQHIARLYLLDQAIKQGDLYPRWVGVLGFNFGYPLFNFYPPLIYYVAEFFHLIGLNLLWSLKLMIITGSFISSFGMYLLGKRFFDKRTGLLAATLHTFFFYRLITVYVRGAWAEFFAMSILPFIFLGFDSIYKSKNIRLPFLFSLTIGFLVVAHPLIAFPTFFFLALFFIYYFINSENKWLFIKNVFIGIFFGLSLSAFFWLPSFMERKYTLVDTILTHELADYKIHFIYPFQLWFSPWGYGGSIAGPNDGMSFQLGKIHIFLTLFSFASFVFCSISVSHYLFLVFLLLFSLFMSLTYSQFIWDTVTYLWYLQFPWRFLAFAGIFISLIAGSSIWYLEKIIVLNAKLRNLLLNLLTIVLLIITVYKYSPYSKPYDPKLYNEKYTTSFEEISWRVSNTSFEFSPKGIKVKKTKLGTTTIGLEKNDVVKESFSVISQSQKTIKVVVLTDMFSKKEFYTESDSPFEFRLNTFNFPGWGVRIDGNEVKINDNNEYKLITVLVPKGKHTVSFIFGNTPIRIGGNIISLFSILGLTFFFYLEKRRVRS